jgi:hypothetical protein
MVLRAPAGAPPRGQPTLNERSKRKTAAVVAPPVLDLHDGGNAGVG